MLDEPVAVVLAAVIGIAGRVFGGWWATTRLYYCQRWWEQKVKTYTELVSELSSVHYHRGTLLRHHSGLAVYSPSDLERVTARVNAHLESAFRSAHPAGFLITTGPERRSESLGN